MWCLLVAGGIVGGVWWVRASSGGSALKRAAELYKLKDWEGAERMARAYLESKPEDPAGLRLLFRTLYRQGRDREAGAISERFGQETMEAEDDLLRGQALVRLGQPQFAVALWRNALLREPHHVEARVALERAFFKADRLSCAAREAEQLALEKGWEGRAQLLLGRVRFQQSDPAGAVAAFERALARFSEWRDLAEPDRVRRLVARCLLRLGQPARARAGLAELDPAGDESETAWLRSRCDLQEGVASEPTSAALALAYRSAHPMEPEPSPYLGEAACARCHEREYREQHRSRHARTYLGKEQFPTRILPASPIVDPGDANVTHTFRQSADGIAIETRVKSRVFETIVDYVFGSGDRGLTPVSHNATGEYFEARLSHYHEPVGWDVTSGHPPGPDLPPHLYQGIGMAEDDLRHCMDCHNTHPMAILTGSGPESSDSAIGCERCHGPGSNHAKAVAAKTAEPAIARPSLASGVPIVALCSECHTPRTRDLKLTRDSPLAPRFPGVTLRWSLCYSESGGALDCVSCHNPHQDVETQAAWYESRCLECHAAPSATALRRVPAAVASERAGGSACPVQPKNGCITCHMPKVKTPVAHTEFTDHFIRVRGDIHAESGTGVQPESKHRR
jgi:tetratricopeptide (TPR) repeat protein